jgi:hypothetical protein
LKLVKHAIAVPLMGFTAQVFVFFGVTRWSHVSPASSSADFLFFIASALAFYLLPLISVLGIISSVQRFRDQKRSLVVGGIALNACFLIGGGIWSLSGLN